MKIKYIIFVFVLFTAFIQLNAQNKTEVNSKQVSELIQKNKKWIILDVRTPEEFKAGHLKGAINIDIKRSDAFGLIDKLDHNATYVVHCRTHHRSQIAVDHMLGSGFKRIYQMMDGYTGWEQNKLPVVR
jgi:rhodanese-related sulfurtransferase